ncbi:hypothetical protein BDN70DRAFT_886280 [Pholiota conissans]|uniref:Uncharacterized protein n=1 Tax=Pholiota conissans TaxID=109636 RepID=A0A9P5YPD1_9AGAR|nr:hypothetical protein BDN70DRAFT_886280 [Pholiota conissans]
MASSALSCQFTGSPPLNTDIAGIGVRISTYVQAFLSIITITVSPSLTDIYNQAFPYVIMNISVTVAALVLGFSSNPQITLQDATVAWYFTVIPFVIHIIAGKKLAHRNKLHNAINTSSWDIIPNIVFLSIMYILSAAFTLAVFRHHETFGISPECNTAARVFFFGTRTITHRWFVGMAVVYGLLLAMVFIPMILKGLLLAWLLSSMRKPENDEERQEAERQQKHIAELKKKASAEVNFEADYRSGVVVFAVLVVWIVFTELTVVKNNFAPAEGSIWQFGQIFPLIILAVPLLSTARAVTEFVKGAPTRRAERARNGKPKEREGLIATIDKIINVPPAEDEKTEKGEIEEVKKSSENI